MNPTIFLYSQKFERLLFGGYLIEIHYTCSYLLMANNTILKITKICDIILKFVIVVILITFFVFGVVIASTILYKSDDIYYKVVNFIDYHSNITSSIEHELFDKIHLVGNTTLSILTQSHEISPIINNVATISNSLTKAADMLYSMLNKYDIILNQTFNNVSGITESVYLLLKKYDIILNQTFNNISSITETAHLLLNKYDIILNQTLNNISRIAEYHDAKLTTLEIQLETLINMSRKYT